MARVMMSAGLVVAAGIFSSMAIVAGGAQSVTPQIAVPDTGGSGVEGCYRVDGTIYGPYRLAFCLQTRSSYTVKGGGLDCKGGLDWYDQGKGRIEIDLYKAKCGSGQAWTGDSLSCNVPDWKPITVKLGYNKLKIPVPVKKYSTLNCTYNPISGGYKPVKVTAKRTT
jgi:hypothetical protein